MPAIALLALYLIGTRRQPFASRPDRLLAATWLLLLGGYEILGEGFVPLSNAFLAIFASFFVLFAVFHWLGRVAASALPRLALPTLFRPNVVIVLGICASMASITLALGAARSPGVLTAMDFRDLLGDAEGGRVSVGVGLTFPLACGGWCTARKLGRTRTAWFLGLLVLAVAIISTSKIFLALFLLFLMPWWGSPVRLRRWAIAGALVAGIAFGLSHVLLDKFSSSPEGRLMGALVDTFQVYLFGGIAGFQQVLAGTATFPEGAMWKPIGDLLPGSLRVPQSAILPWTTVGEWETNVYSAFAYWFDAFDAASGVVVGAALGLFYGLTFGRERVGCAMEFMRTYLLFPLLFMFHQDFFLPSLLGHIGFLGAALLLDLTELPMPLTPGTGSDQGAPEGPVDPTYVLGEGG